MCLLHGLARVLGAWRGNNIHGLRTETTTLPQAAGPCISKDAEDGRQTRGRAEMEGRGCGKKALPAWRIDMT